MRIDCEVHAFRREARRVAPIIDGSFHKLEDAARDCAITGLVLVQPASMNGDPTELFAQASQARMPVRLIPPLVQPVASEVLEGWGRSGAVGVALTLEDPDPLAESLEVALQLGFHLEVWGASKDVSTWQNCSWPTAIALVFRGFGLAESARDPVWDPRLERLLAFAKSAEVWVKLSGIGRVPDDWAQAAVGRMLDELGPEQLLWGSEWPHVMVAHAYAPSYAESLKWLGGGHTDEQARRQILGETSAALYGFRN